MEQDILLQILDAQWKDHLHTMDGLREGVSLRGMGGRDPKLEYQREGYALFEEMNQRIDTQASDVIFKFALPEPVQQVPSRSMPGTGPGSESPEASGSRAGTPAPKGGGRAAAPKASKIGRNDPCTCGSGRKYKKCCGAL
jgi:preprotein translocase subunit SecA